MKIGKKLTLAFLLISLCSLATIGILSYVIAENMLAERVLDQLESVATVQRNRLESMINQNLERLALVASRTQLRLSLKAFDENPETKYQEKMNQILRDARSSIACFQDISVLNLKGEIVASTNPENVGKTLANEEFFVRGQKQNNADMLFLDPDKNLKVRLSGPLLLEGKLLGVVTIESHTKNIISLVSDYSGLGKTGETLLARRDKNGDAVFLIPLRFDEQAVLKRTLSKDNLDVPITQALLRNEKFFPDAVDYRGERVLAATRYIQETDWGLVVKIDRAEAFAPIDRLRTLLLIIVSISAFVVILVSFRLAHTITKPIADLTRATSKIAQGDLSLRVEPTSRDEVGTLAQAFNEMSRNLQESYGALKEEVAERKQAEERLKHLNAVLRAIRGVNQLITKEHDLDSLIKGACENLIETRGYNTAWIAVLDESGGLAAAHSSRAAYWQRKNHLQLVQTAPCRKNAMAKWC
jgi:HAMP domain-containing protein